MGMLSEKNIDITNVPFSAENFAELIALVYTERVNSTNAQKILAEMLEAKENKDPTHIMEEKGYGQVRDEGAIEKLVEDVIGNFPEQVQQFKDGKDPVIKFLVGMVMKASEGSADPKMVEDTLRDKLSS